MAIATQFGAKLARPVVANVIAGVTGPEQLARNVAAGSRDLRPEELAAIRAIAVVG